MIKEAEHLDYEWYDGKMKIRLEYRLLRHKVTSQRGGIRGEKDLCDPVSHDHIAGRDIISVFCFRPVTDENRWGNR